MKDNEYKCAMCGGIYEKGWTDEEAKAEATQIFGKNPDDWNDNQSVVCNDCFNAIHPNKYPEVLVRAKEVI